MSDAGQSDMVKVPNSTEAIIALHGHSSTELHGLLTQSNDFTIPYTSVEGEEKKVNVLRLAEFLPLCIKGFLRIFNRDESLFNCLCGVRLKHSLYNVAYPYSHLNELSLNCQSGSMKLIDLVTSILNVLQDCEQNFGDKNFTPLLHSTLLASSLYLLNEGISQDWEELARALVAQSKVDVFMNAAFGAVEVSIKSLKAKMLILDVNNSNMTSRHMVQLIGRQCDASLRFLRSLCRQECIFEIQDIWKDSSIIFLVKGIMELDIEPLADASSCNNNNNNNNNNNSNIIMVNSNLKLKILSILVDLCKTEKFRFLDEVVNSPPKLESMNFIVLEVIKLFKSSFSDHSTHFGKTHQRKNPKGLFQLTAMRLIEILSKDSNFRSLIIDHFTEVLARIFLLPQNEFEHCWCSSDPVRVLNIEIDDTTKYDAFAEAWWAVYSNSTLSEESNEAHVYISSEKGKATLMNLPQYSTEKAPSIVKIISSLYSFIPPDMPAGEEKFPFLDKFMESSRAIPVRALNAEKWITLCKNLSFLIKHATSRMPNPIKETDVELLRQFFNKLKSLIVRPEREEIQEPELARTGNRQPEKRRRCIMNNNQTTVFEKAVLDEPDMQRNQASLQSWAEKLSAFGPQVTPSQLKNWIINKKSKQRRMAMEVQQELLAGTSSSHSRARQESEVGPSKVPEASQEGSQQENASAEPRLECCMPGQYVQLVDKEGNPIGRGNVHQVYGHWRTMSLITLEACVIDITELQVERSTKIPYASPVIGKSFEEAEEKLGKMRVLWSNKQIYLLRL